MILLRNIREPSNVHLPELQVWKAVVAGQLREDAGKVDAGGGPGRVEGDHPDDILIPVELLAEGVVPEVDDVFRAFVRWLGQQKALQ